MRRDNTDDKEFHGTPSNMCKFPDSADIMYVFDSESDIIVEGFSLQGDCLPHCVIQDIKQYFRNNKNT